MQVKTIGWIVGSLGLLVGAGTAWGGDTTTETTTETTEGSDLGQSVGGRA